MLTRISIKNFKGIKDTIVNCGMHICSNLNLDAKVRISLHFIVH